MFADIIRMTSPATVDVVSQLAGIKSNLTFDHLVNLKRQGATFGQLSDNELRAIESAIIDLNVSASPELRSKKLNEAYGKLTE